MAQFEGHPVTTRHQEPIPVPCLTNLIGLHPWQSLLPLNAERDKFFRAAIDRPADAGTTGAITGLHFTGDSTALQLYVVSVKETGIIDLRTSVKVRKRALTSLTSVTADWVPTQIAFVVGRNLCATSRRLSIKDRLDVNDLTQHSCSLMVL